MSRRVEMLDCSYAFALRVIQLSQFLDGQRQYVLSRQILKSGTSIGANITEAQQAESQKDFIHKLSIANKEAFETEYWLKLLRDGKYITEVQAVSMIADCSSLQRMLVSAIRTMKSR